MLRPDTGPSRASPGPKLGTVISSLPAALADPSRSEIEHRAARSAAVILHRRGLSVRLPAGPGLLRSGVIHPATAQCQLDNKPRSRLR